MFRIFLSLMLMGLPLPSQTPAPDLLKITILDGDNAINNVRQRTAREPIVQVEDENHNRVPGAVVVFTAPNQGAGGAFLNGARTLTVTTDNQGRAIAQGFRPNNVAGKFELRVNASYQGKTGHAVIQQENISPPPTTHVSPKWIAITAVVAGGIAGGVVAATHNGGGSSAPPATPASVVLTPGTGTVGPPR